MGITAAMVGFVPVTSYATPAPNEVPTGGKVAEGNALIDDSAKDKGLMNIVQTSDRAIINWDTFNVGSKSVVNFIHLIQSKGGDKELVLNTAGSTLNIVNASGGMSEIYGTINSVGSFMLVNQNGILFANGSEVNAAGIVASTAPINESRYFNNAQLIFEQDKGYNNSVIADGKLDANTYYDGNTTQNEGTKAITEQFGNDVAAAAINAAMKQSDALKKQFGGEMPTINMATVNAATGFAVGENSIKLVADGDVVVGEHANIVANRVHELSGKSSVGSEDFTTTTDGKWIRGSVVLRADANGDDVAAYDEAAREYASSGYREDENGYDVYTKPNNSLNQEQVKVKEVMAKVPKTDSAGLIVYEKDDSGNLKTDENGNLIPRTERKEVEVTIKQKEKIPAMDEYGEQRRDSDGNLIYTEVEVPRQALDENGNKKTDANENPVYVKAYEGAFSSTSDGVMTNGGKAATFKSAKVYLSNKDKSIKGNDVSIYQTADIVNGVNGTDAENVGIEGTDHKFTQADYAAKHNYHDSNKYEVVNSNHGSSLTDAIMINNVYQLEAIQDTAEVNPVNVTEQGTDGGNAPETDTKATDDTVKDSNFGDLNGSYALGSAIHGGVYTYKGKEIDDAETSKWNGGAGFKPVGNDKNPFTGGFTGSGGITTYGIYDITINRPTENNVGLFGVVDSVDKKYHASIWSTSVIDSNIIGNENVGGIVGLARGAWLDGDTVRKRVKAHDGTETLIQTKGTPNVSGNKNVGGLVGKMENSSMRNGTNASFVQGIDVKADDGTIVSSPENIGGLVGFAEGKRDNSTETIVGGVNEAYFSGMTNDKKDTNENIIETGEKTTAYANGFGKVAGGDNSKNVGGLVGKLGNSEGKAAIISVSDSKRFSHNGGEVTGGENVGGLVGTMENAGSKIEDAYNTNEQYALTPDSKITEDATGAGTSKYGAVTGNTNVGGLVGEMKSGTITTSYNAGNVKGTTNVGGLIGTMEDGKVDKGYNADNNTVVVKADNGEKYYGFTVEHTGSYQWVEDNGKQTYKWVPDETTGKTSYGFDQTTQQWKKYDSDGNLLKSKDGKDYLTTAEVLEEAPEEVRTYNNRIAYRDATVTGEANVGGVVGTMAGGEINQVYNAGRVNDVSTNGKADNESKASIGDFGGTKNGGKVEGGFYITTRQNGTPITVQEQAWGTGANDGVSSKDLYHATNADGAVIARDKDGTTTVKVDGGIDWTDTKTGTNEHRNQSKDWVVYSNSSAPLLKEFMTPITINRQFEYDGTTHNLVTTDVDNYYGGAFFTGGKGTNVYTEGVKTLEKYDPDKWTIKSGTDLANTTKSSVYRYDNADMWSPQHGYITEENAQVIITPREVTINLNGEKMYGDSAVTGVVDAGEASTDTANKYKASFSYVDYEFDEKSGKYNPKTVEVKHGENGYEVGDTGNEEFNGMLGELGNVLDGRGKNAEGKSAFDGTIGEIQYVKEKGTDGKAVDGKGDSANLSANTYDINGSENLANKDGSPMLSATNGNYIIKYDGELVVKKARIDTEIDGKKIYGQENADGTVTFKITKEVFTNLNDATKEELEKHIVTDIAKNYTVDGENGNIWKKTDSGDYTITLKGSTMKKLVADNTIALTNNGGQADSQEINAKTDVIMGSDGKEAAYMLRGGYDGTKIDDIILGTYKDGENTIENNYELVFQKGTFTITQRPLYYDVQGKSVYGEGAEKAEYGISLSSVDKANANIEGLVNGDKIENVFVANGEGKYVDETLAKESLKDQGIDEKTHVKRDKDGNVINAVEVDLGENNDKKFVTLNDNNHNYKTEAKNVTYMVTPATLTYKADDKTKVYGQTGIAGTGQVIKGFVNGEKNIGDVHNDPDAKPNKTSLLPDEFLYKTEVINTPNANVIKTNEKDADGKPKYGAYDNAIKPKELLYFNDYNVEYQNGSVTITPKVIDNTVTFTINHAEKKYGDETPHFTGTFTDGAIVAGDEKRAENINIVLANGGDQKNSDVGEYNLTTTYDKIQTNLGNNYIVHDNVDIKTNTMTINKKPITYTTGSGTRTFGDKLDTVKGGHFDKGSLVEGDKLVDNTDTNYSGKDKAGNAIGEYTDVGTYDVYASEADALNTIEESRRGNYTIKTINGGKLEITKASIGTVINGERIYGQPNSDGSVTFTVASAAFKNEATKDAFVKAVDASHAAGKVGWTPNKDDKGNITSYSITLSGDAVKSYVATEAVRHKEYTAAELKNMGLSSADNVIDEMTNVKVGNDGKYTLGVGTAINSNNTSIQNKNYNLVFDSGNYTITPRTLKYNVVGEKVYGDDVIDATGNHPAANVKYEVEAGTFDRDNGTGLASFDKEEDVFVFGNDLERDKEQKIVIINEAKRDLADEARKTIDKDGAINERTHVKRGENGEILNVIDEVYTSDNRIELSTKNPNYKIDIGKFKYKVTPKDITYKAPNATKTYGDDASGIKLGAVDVTTGNFSGFALDDNIGNVYEDTTARANKTKVDEYVISDNVKDAKTDAGTYTGAVSFETVDGKPNADLYLNDYDVKYENGDAIINKRDVVYHTGSGKRVYGDKLDTVGGGYFDDGNLVNGHTSTGITTYSGTNGNVINEKTDAGKYSITTTEDEALATLGGNAKNYNVTEIKDGTLEITKRKLSGEFNIDNATKTYGDTYNKPFNGSFTFTDGTSIMDWDKNLVKNIAITSDGSDAQADVEDNGYAITTTEAEIKRALGKNYDTDGITTITDGTLTIKPRNITYKVDDKEKWSDEADPALSGHFMDGGIMSWDEEHVGKLGSGAFDIPGKTTDDKEKLARQYDIKVREDIPVTDVVVGEGENKPGASAADASTTPIDAGNADDGAASMRRATNDTMPIGDGSSTGGGAPVDGDESAMPSVKTIGRSEAMNYILGSAAKNYKVNIINGKLTIKDVKDRPAPVSEGIKAHAETAKITDSGEYEPERYIADEGGKIDREGRGTLRFITIEDTGINLKMAALDNNNLTVFYPSYEAGSGYSVFGDGDNGVFRIIGDGSGIFVEGTSPIIRGTTIDTLPDTAVIAEYDFANGGSFFFPYSEYVENEAEEEAPEEEKIAQE